MKDYYDEIYKDKDKKYYKRFKAIQKNKRAPSEKDILYLANILKISVNEIKKKKYHYYAIDIDEIKRL
jgi:hypothetical protein